MTGAAGSQTPNSRIGVMGGSFDPIHNGHLAVAEAARRKFGLERVIFIPTGKSPHKNSSVMTPSAQRFEMTLLAVSGNDNFDVSKIEIERPGASYTADTLSELRRQYGKKARLYFIAGADSMSEIFTWRAPGRIFELCSIIAVSRPGVDAGLLNSQIEKARGAYGAAIYTLDMPLLEISSTDIRKRVQIGQPIRYLTPEAVEQYIKKYRLYREDPYDMEAAEGWVCSLLSDKRWLHTMGVVSEAVRLSEIYGANRRKAYITSVFHDCAKEMPAGEKLRNCEKWGIPLDSVMRSQIDLAHGLLSAEMARLEFNVDDPEILNAIRYHTTGCGQMSLLDKILLTADCIEPHRKGYAWLEDIRGAAPNDLDKAVALALRMKIAYTKSKNQEVHPLSIKALEEIENKGDFYG